MLARSEGPLVEDHPVHPAEEAEEEDYEVEAEGRGDCKEM